VSRKRRHFEGLSKPDIRSRKKVAPLRIRLTASDVGYLREIYAPAGAEVAVGDLLATITSDQHEVVEASPETPPPHFRVVANLVDGREQAEI
jgi:pyruvate/2-oxoglutarate dehydrogenase complex dihydrolipoamide acyltransferase (E2) component